MMAMAENRVPKIPDTNAARQNSNRVSMKMLNLSYQLNRLNSFL